MSVAVDQLALLRREIEAMRSLPLLALDDFVEYSRLCERARAMASELVARPYSVANPEETGRDLYDLALALRRSGDGLASAELFELAGAFTEARDDCRRASSSYNSAAITLYQLGVYDRAYSLLDRALGVLGDDDFGLVRGTGILMNRANVLHYERRFEEAEVAYLALYARVEALAPELFAANSTFGHAEVLGILSLNLAGNRCLWAQRDAEHGLPTIEHTSRALAFLRDAEPQPLKPFASVTSQCLQAHIDILEGRPDPARRLLSRISEQCTRDEALHPLLPQIYRYEAEACLALGDATRALSNCHRALEASLAVANDLEERSVVDTFVDLLRLTSRCIFEPSDPAPVKARRFLAQASGLVGSLVDFLERKDWYTSTNHARSVASLSVRLGRALRARDDAIGDRARAEIDEPTLELAGLLHDIGKLALPWSLLNRIAPLGPWEIAFLRTHPARGREILTRGGLPEIGVLTAEHHEMPDGTGYPSGAREISVMGSILAVAEAFEAMTSANRRNQTPKSTEQAVREIVGGSGTQFDPAVAETLVTIFVHEL